MLKLSQVTASVVATVAGLLLWPLPALATDNEATAKPGWPSVGDRWVYEAREATRPENRHAVTVDVLEVGPSSIRDVLRSSAGDFELVHEAKPVLAGTVLGIASLSPYLRAFQEMRGGGGVDPALGQ